MTEEEKRLGALKLAVQMKIGNVPGHTQTVSETAKQFLKFIDGDEK